MLFVWGSFCRINRVSCAHDNDQSHMYSSLRAPERRFGARRGRHSLDVVKQAAPTYQMLPALRAKSEEAMQESEQHRNRKVALRTFRGPICVRKTGRKIRTRHSKF
jgi:hypothetical protein